MGERPARDRRARRDPPADRGLPRGGPAACRERCASPGLRRRCVTDAEGRQQRAASCRQFGRVARSTRGSEALGVVTFVHLVTTLSPGPSRQEELRTGQSMIGPRSSGFATRTAWIIESAAGRVTRLLVPARPRRSIQPSEGICPIGSGANAVRPNVLPAQIAARWTHTSERNSRSAADTCETPGPPLRASRGTPRKQSPPFRPARGRSAPGCCRSRTPHRAGRG
jgi:hypothetical protein